MKLKLLKVFIIVFFGFLLSAHKASASTAGASAMLASIDISYQETDNRAEVLRSFLEKYDSPLALYSSNFIEEADKNNIDWKLVAAIAGNESYFGQMIPPFSYNGWGYGVYGDNVRRFSSWEEGIAVVSSAIRTDYIDKWGATNVYEIGSIYAEDPMWANKVTNYMSKIEDFNNQTSNSSLPISL